MALQHPSRQSGDVIAQSVGGDDFQLSAVPKDQPHTMLDGLDRQRQATSGRHRSSRLLATSQGFAARSL
jgi:hypothetical protein